ncbi:MAG: hypothetical protein V7642_4916 [Burkholderiales bacterium]|jgi:hypothetical protein
MTYRLLILILHLGIFFALGYGYENDIVVVYGYEGYRLEPNQDYWYVAFAAVVAMSLITPIKAERPSTLFYHVTLTFVLIPMLVMFYAQNNSPDYIAMVIACYALSVFLLFGLKVNPPRIAITSKSELRRILFVIACVYIASIFLLGGHRYLNFDISKVYDLRDEAADNLPGIFGYISPLMGKVVVPIAFVLSLLYRKYVMALVFFGISVLIFGLTAHKAPLFFPFLILFVYIVSTGKNLTLKFNLSVLAILLLCLWDFVLLQKYGPDGGFGWVGNLVLRREFFLPGQINYWYYDFFSRHGFVWFSNSKITLGMLDYPYPLDVSYLIGREYMESERTGANTGWFGSGYMQAGFAGLLLYAAATAAIFKYIDACARQTGERALITAAVVIPVFALITSTDLLTAFFTHGLYVNLLLIACFNRKESFDAYSPSEQRAFA